MKFKDLPFRTRFAINRAAVRARKDQVGDTIFAPAILSWFGIPVEMTEGNTWQAWSARSQTTGQRVTVDTALQIAAVWACVKLIAGTIATLPLGVYERRPDGSKKARPDHPVHSLIAISPNADMTPTQFWDVTARAMLLWGDGMSVVQKIGKRPIALDFMLPHRLTKRRLMVRGGPIAYQYTDFDGVQRPVDASTIMRIPGVSSDGINGLSVIQHAANVFGAAQAANEASGKMFENGLRPSGVLTIDKFLTEAQREDVRDNIVSKFAGAENASKAMVLEGGMKWDSIAIPPEDAQLLQTRHFDVEEVCRWFGVPPFMIGHSEKNTSWGTGIEQQVLGFLNFSLRPWLVRVTQAAGRALLTPAERATLFIDFSIEELLRADSAARALFYANMAQNGIMTRNEIRNRENLADLPGGDKLTVQSNLVPLDKLGETPAGETEPGFGLPAPKPTGNEPDSDEKP